MEERFERELKEVIISFSTLLEIHYMLEPNITYTCKSKFLR